ncbi:V-type ATP synthase subunit A [Candidatus Woesearchaeota archaeon]|nr:V-type ATP synthase subunit A [Candidatus Woesearchaeota archaeon]
MGDIYKVSGPLVIGDNLDRPMLNEIVKIGKKNLFGEIIRIFQNKAMIQVYEPTEGLKPGDNITQTGEMFQVELGPGMLKNVFDGIQRPLEGNSIFLEHGFLFHSLDREKKWDFQPSKKIKKGDILKGGEIIGMIQETNTTDHKILVPPDIKGELVFFEKQGSYNVDKVVARIKTRTKIEDIKLYHKWPVRVPRPYNLKTRPEIPLRTGLRVIDFFFPAAQGGTIAIPGGFGTGKTQLIFNLIKWSDADVLIYIGCGERGNEVITVLEEISHLVIKGELLDERTIYIINTSNMPVAARTSGIFSGITIAEYFRDQGKKVAILADSITRWAEAMREISNRIGDFPGEEGYPTYLSSEIGNFFERAGNVVTLSGNKGSITTIGSISLYGSDFSDPVAQASMKVASCLWALDPNLAYVRHYPAINRNVSYSKHILFLRKYWEKYGNWYEYYHEFLNLFGKIDELEKLTSVMGKDMLAEDDQFLLEFNELFTELFLKQSALVIEDAHRDPIEQVKMAELLLTYYHRGKDALKKGISLEEISNKEIHSKLIKLKTLRKNKYIEQIDELINELIFVKKND